MESIVNFASLEKTRNIYNCMLEFTFPGEDVAD